MSLKDLDPFDGPASENAYPEDLAIEADGKRVSMNDLARTYNSLFGEVDEAAGKPWQGPDRTPEQETGDENIVELEVDQALLDRVLEHNLESASQLPDLEGDDLVIEWDVDEEISDDGDHWIVLRHGDQVIWREIAFLGISRFDLVMWILREKYGSRLAALRPTDESLALLRLGNEPVEPIVEALNEELEAKRGAREDLGFIDVEDAEGEAGDPVRQERELQAALEEMGDIDCSCGWVGQATEARVRTVSGDTRDLGCPDCRRPLFRIQTED